MQYQEPPPIFGSLIFYQKINCSEQQLNLIVPQLTAILQGQRIANRTNSETIKKAFYLAISNAIVNWNKKEPSRKIIIQLFVGERRWGVDISNESKVEMEEVDYLGGDIKAEQELQFLDECMDEVYYFMERDILRFMMIRSR